MTDREQVGCHTEPSRCEDQGRRHSLGPQLELLNLFKSSRCLAFIGLNRDAWGPCRRRFRRPDDQQLFDGESTCEQPKKPPSRMTDRDMWAATPSQAGAKTN